MCRDGEVKEKRREREPYSLVSYSRSSLWREKKKLKQKRHEKKKKKVKLVKIKKLR